MSFHLSAPGKTFIVGEYIALKGAATLVLTTPPYFELQATAKAASFPNYETLFHPESPAGKLVKAYAKLFDHFQLHFKDPYYGMGGFGASTAQYVMLNALKEHLLNTHLKDQELLTQYIQHAWSGQGWAPSGADLIAQRHGGLCIYHKVAQQLETISWPFPDLSYGLVHTGHKQATHTHLQQQIHFNEEPLKAVALRTIASVKDKERGSFIESIHEYGLLLREQNLVTHFTQEILKKMYAFPPIRAAKGCGALGADVVLILFHATDIHEIKDWLQEKKLKLIRAGIEVAKGVTLTEEI